MNNKILTQLVRAGLVDADCTVAQYQAAIANYFGRRSMAVPIGDDAILTAMGAKTSPIIPGASHADNLRIAAVDALVSQHMRSARSATGRVSVGLQNWEQLGRSIVRASGVSSDQADGLPPMELAQLLLQGRQQVSMGSSISAEAAYNTSGMFSNILYDASM